MRVPIKLKSVMQRITYCSEKYRYINVFMEVFAGGSECLGGSVLKVPEFILHSATELLRVAFPLQVKLDTYGSILCK